MIDGLGRIDEEEGVYRMFGCLDAWSMIMNCDDGEGRRRMIDIKIFIYSSFYGSGKEVGIYIVYYPLLCMCVTK